jgi:hypothetical protein
MAVVIIQIMFSASFIYLLNVMKQHPSPFPVHPGFPEFLWQGTITSPPPSPAILLIASFLLVLVMFVVKFTSALQSAAIAVFIERILNTDF